MIPCGFPGFWESIPPPARGFGITQSTTDRAMESQTKAFLKMHGETGPVGAPCPLAVRMAGHGGCSSLLTAAPLSARSLRCRRPPQPQDQPVQVVRLHSPSLPGEGVLQQLQPQLLLRGPPRDLRGHMVRETPSPGADRGRKGVCSPVLELFPIAVIQGFLSP